MTQLSFPMGYQSLNTNTIFTIVIILILIFLRTQIFYLANEVM